MMTLRRRLLLTLLPALAASMALGGVADYWVAALSARDAYDHALASGASALAAGLRVTNTGIQFETPAIEQTSPDVRFYRINTSAGQLIAGNRELPTVALTSRQGPVGYTDTDFEGRSLRIASMRVSTTAGPVLVTVGEPKELRTRAQRVMLFGKLLVDLAELDVMLLLIWVAVYVGVRPLESLRNQVESAEAFNVLRPLDDSRVPGELRSTVVSFNRVLELLRDAAAAQQRFVADAAHQLRTPVAGLLAQMELLLNDAQAAGVTMQLANLQSGIQRLAHSANQLLSLMRADPLSSLHDQFAPVDLRALVETLIVRHLPRADERQIDLGADVTAASLMGDPWLLEDLLGNLIDNALKYTPAGGRVTVRCGLSDGQAYLEVEDNGPGIPVVDRQRVKERFYRAPGSTGIGCGLGLAIVEEIARVHRADFTISAGAHEKGCLMRIRFPRSG